MNSASEEKQEEILSVVLSHLKDNKWISKDQQECVRALI